MTPKERAGKICIEAFDGSNHPEGWLEDRIADSIREAEKEAKPLYWEERYLEGYRAGRESMREEAANDLNYCAMLTCREGNQRRIRAIVLDDK